MEVLRSVDTNRDIVVVIDPGHGGTNEGASYKGIDEKYITVKTANVMYEELSKFEGVKVYITHTDAEQDMSLAQRAEYAKSVAADYLISLHYNASATHKSFGCEVWIPSISSYYVEGYQLADKFIDEFKKIGINSRGIKTKIGDDGDEYYGIIRESESRDITAIIVEHCYLDNYNDDKYWDSEEDLINYGKSDAIAVARFLKLKSSVLEEDFSEEENVYADSPEQRIYQDSTPPQIHNVKVTEYVKKDRRLEFSIEAEDEETFINYYSYSLDGGESFSELFLWDESLDNDMDVVIENVSEENIELMVRVYNQYDLKTQSEVIEVQAVEDKADYRSKSHNKFLPVALMAIFIIIISFCLAKKINNKFLKGYRKVK